MERGVVSLSGKPEMVAEILGETPEPCQHIFQILIRFAVALMAL